MSLRIRAFPGCEAWVCPLRGVVPGRAREGGCVPAATGKMAALTSLSQVKMQRFKIAHFCESEPLVSTVWCVACVKLYFNIS